jgi:hypothetical protein
MSQGKRNSKRKGRTKAVTVLGVAGALSLAGGGSEATVGPPSDTLMANTAVTLCEEEIFDVSLSTFYAFDHESAGARRPGLQLTERTRRGRPRQDSGGSGDCGGGGPTCCATCATMPGCGADRGERGRAVALLAAALTGSIRPLDRTPALPLHRVRRCPLTQEKQREKDESRCPLTEISDTPV